MKFSTKIILGVLVFAALCLIYYSDNYFSKKKEEKKEELSKALFFKPADVLKFTLKNKSGAFSFARENNKSDWKMLEPQKINADNVNVSNTISALSQITVQQIIPGTEEAIKKDKSYLSQFGLDNPEIIGCVTLSNGKTESLEIGGNIEIGFKNSGKVEPVSSYGLNLNRPSILALDKANINLIYNKNFNDFRTKNVALFKRKDVFAVSMSSKNGKVLVEKKQDIWNEVIPENVLGDDMFISSFIGNYESMAALKVIEKGEVAKFGKAYYDLENPAVRTQFLDEKGKVLQEFLLGITKEAIYVQMPDGAVGKLSLSSWTDYAPTISKFRDRQVLSAVKINQINAIKLNNSTFYVKKDLNWFKVASLSTPIHKNDKSSNDALSFMSNFEFMTADDVFIAPTPFELEKYGLTRPIKSFSFLFDKETQLNPLEISIGNRVPHNEKNVYIKRSDRSAIYVVNADWLTQLGKL